MIGLAWKLAGVASVVAALGMGAAGHPDGLRDLAAVWRDGAFPGSSVGVSGQPLR